MSVARLNKKTKIAIVTAALVFGVSGTAFAYWTQLGAGTGSAGTGTTVAVVVRQTSTITGLYPGGAAVPLAGNFDNPNTAAVTVGLVTGTVTTTSLPATCLASWYAITGTGSPATQVLAGSGVGTGAWSGLNVALVNQPATNQDACKGATITITYAVAAG
jgi:hypothetical protein